MTHIPYTHKQIKAVSLATGVSPYKLKKWYADASILAIEVGEVLDYLRRADVPDTTIPADELVHYFGNDETRMNNTIASGAILPLYDGTFYSADLTNLTPHRFAVLPPRKDYTPTRPPRNEPIKWYPNTAAKQAQFQAAFTKRKVQCDWWENDGKVFTIPDGCHAAPRVRGVRLTWRDEYTTNPPLYVASEPDELGKVVRIKIQGFSTTHETVVNLAIMDDWGVWLYAHGVYARKEAWHEALYRAVLATGLRVAPALDIPHEILRLQKWLDSASDMT